jgi:hypothetical protein
MPDPEWRIPDVESVTMMNTMAKTRDDAEERSPATIDE